MNILQWKNAFFSLQRKSIEINRWKGNREGKREAIAKLENDRAGRGPSLVTRVWTFWPTISFFFLTRHQVQDERPWRTRRESDERAICKLPLYNTAGPRCVYLPVVSILLPLTIAKSKYNGYATPWQKRKFNTQTRWVFPNLSRR